MRLIRWLVLALVGLWLIGEVAAIPIAERLIEQEVTRRYRDAATIEADIDSFPVVARLLATEKVNRLTVTLDRVARQTITFAEVRFEFSGLVVDRSAMLGGNPRVREIDRGSVTATIDAGALGGIASLTGVEVRVIGRTLHAGEVAVAIERELVPCPPQARVEGDRVVLTCEIDEVPETLLDAAQRD